jgi:tricorn protease
VRDELLKREADKRCFLIAAACVWLLTSICTAQSATLARFPNTHDKQGVFEAHGHLWISDGSQGYAGQLTQGSCTDVMARFSPNGQWFAFSRIGRLTEDVYIIAAAGGEPRRLIFRSSKPGGPGPTFRADDNVVVTWTPDSSFQRIESHL